MLYFSFPMNHEALERHEAVQPPSERSFALVFTAFFALVAVWPLLKGRPWRPWALGVAAAMLLLGLLAPAVLQIPNRLWFQLSLLLNRIVSPVVMGIVYYVVVTPFGVTMRMTGKDPLRLKPDPAASTYWVERTPPGPEPETMAEQF